MAWSHEAYFSIPAQLSADILLMFSTLLILPYRYFVYILARIFKPDLKLIGPGITHMFCQPHIEDRFFPNTVTVMVTVAGHIHVDDFRKLFNQKILQYQSNDGRYPLRRFQNTIESFMGYWFWSDVIDFNLKQHIRNYNIEGEYSACDNNSLNEILAQLSKVPWVKDRSPWEIIVTPCKNSQTLFIVRWHHCLADGLSMARVMRLLMDTETLSTNKTKIGKGGFQILPQHIFNIPRDTAKARGWLFETIPNSKKTLHSGTSFTKPFQVDAIKGIMSRHSVSYQTVLSTVSSSALQRALEEGGHPVPKYVLAFIGFKTPKHTEHMINDFLPGFAPMLVMCPSLKTRLSETEEHINGIKNSTFHLGQYYRVYVASYLPTLLRNWFFAWNSEKGTIYVANFPWFGKMSLLGKEVVDMMAIAEVIPGVFDISVLPTGCLHRIRFGVSVSNVFPVDAEKQCNYLELEMERLINLE